MGNSVADKNEMTKSVLRPNSGKARTESNETSQSCIRQEYRDALRVDFSGPIA